MIVRLEPLDLEMMFGLAVAVKAEFIGMLHITAHFLEEALVKFRSLAGHSLFDFVPPPDDRSEEHTSELQSLMRISYAVFCLKKKKITTIKLQSTNRREINHMDTTNRQSNPY